MEVTKHSAVTAIQEVELFLRKLLTSSLSCGHGPNWIAAISERVRKELLRLENLERELRGDSKVDENPLAYAGLAEIKAISQHHWECCGIATLGIWADQSTMVRDIDRLMTVRGPGAHGREIQPHELLEAEGTARRLLAAAYRVSPLSEPGPIWSFIKRAADSLGNRSNLGPCPVLTGTQPLRVGDRIELSVEAEDPRGRPLQYRLLDRDIGIVLPWQGSSTFSWRPQKSGRSTNLSIEVRSLSGPWGHDNCDDFVEFRYEIHP